ncbi:HTH CENPB-type domain-containing protein [Schizosaccharomyces pombe]
MPPLRRQALTLAEKKAIRKHYFESATKPSQQELISWFEEHFHKKLAQSTVSSILSSKNEFLDNLDAENSQIRRNRQGKYPILENALIDWQTRLQKQDGAITGNAIKKSAAELWRRIPEYSELPIPEFSNGWLEKFKKRCLKHGLKLQGESTSVNQGTYEENMVQIQELISLFDPKDIFNMDETGLCWKLIPNQSPASERVKGITRDKARVTVTICCNATGSEKAPLWVIGYAKSPRAFRQANAHPDSMDFHWRYNGTARMTTSIMEEWLRWFDDLMKGRKVLLILDKFVAHECALENIRNSERKLVNTTVVFLPVNSTEIYHPCGQEIVYAFKSYYRKYWLNYMLEEIRLGKNPSKTINVLKAVRWMIRSWNVDFEPSIIYNCFLRSGLFQNQQPLTGPSPETIRIAVNLQELIGKYLGDKDIFQIENFINPIEENSADTNDDIVNQVAAQFLDEREFETDEEEEESQYLLSTKDAINAINTLLNFQEQSEDGNVLFTRTLLQFQKVLESRSIV